MGFGSVTGTSSKYVIGETHPPIFSTGNLSIDFELVQSSIFDEYFERLTQNFPLILNSFNRAFSWKIYNLQQGIDGGVALHNSSLI